MQNETSELIEKLDLPFPWETNARGQIVMTPVNYGHSSHVGDLIQLFARIAPEWKTGGRTWNRDLGWKAPDMTLASLAYHERHKDEQGYVEEAPEICIEVMSPANSWQEMQDNMPLHFEVGARGVWTVDTDGRTSFFGPGHERIPQNRLMPAAPTNI